MLLSIFMYLRTLEMLSIDTTRFRVKIQGRGQINRLNMHKNNYTKPPPRPPPNTENACKKQRN